MRSLRRPSVALPTLVRDAGYRCARAVAASKRAAPDARVDFPSHWNNADVRGALYAMHGRVCAYCQCELPHNDRGDVEHFRPKHSYWWLAYAFENYLLSCSCCNRRYKRDRFPSRVSAPPQRGVDDGRLLLDPVADPVEAWLRTDFEQPHCPVEARPDAVLTAHAKRQITETVTLFKLNRNPRLMQERIELADEVLAAVDAGPDAAQRAALKRRACRYQPHAATVRSILAAYAPELLPSPGEELRWLVERYVEDLELIELARRCGVEEEELSTHRDELCWALAVIWYEPDCTARAEVEGWLGGTAELERIRRHRDELAALATGGGALGGDPA